MTMIWNDDYRYIDHVNNSDYKDDDAHEQKKMMMADHDNIDDYRVDNDVASNT